MASSSQPLSRSALEPCRHPLRELCSQERSSVHCLAEAPGIVGEGAAGLSLGSRVGLKSFRPGPWEGPQGGERFQILQRIGADDSPQIQYRPQRWPMCPADKSKRAQKVCLPPTEPLNARQDYLHDEPPEFYRPDRALRAPLAAPTGRSSCLRQSGTEPRLGSALATAAPAGGERSLRHPPIPNRSRLSRRVHSFRAKAKGGTRAL